MTQISIRIDEQLKNQISEKAKEMWISLSSLTKLFYKSFIKNENIVKVDTEEITKSFDVSSKKWKNECISYFKSF